MLGPRDPADKPFPGEIDIFCPSCHVCCVLEEKEIHHIIPDIWHGEGTCFHCGKPLPKVAVKLYGSSPS